MNNNNNNKIFYKIINQNNNNFIQLNSIQPKPFCKNLFYFLYLYKIYKFF